MNDVISNDKRVGIAPGRFAPILATARRAWGALRPIAAHSSAAHGQLLKALGDGKTSVANNRPTGAAPGLSPVLQQIVRPSAQGNWIYSQAKSYTPDLIDSILRLGQFGDLFSQWQLFQLMEDTWPRLAKNLNEVKRAVTQMQWTISPPPDIDGDADKAEAERRADFVREVLFAMTPEAGDDANDFRDTVYDILDSWGKGVSVLEIDWERKASSVGPAIAPKQTRWVHPQNYGYDFTYGRLALRKGGPGLMAGVGGPTMPVAYPGSQENGPAAFIPFVRNKFIVTKARHRSGLVTGAAMLRPLAFWWAASNFTAGFLLNFAQIFGMPIRWASYDPQNQSLLPLIEDMLQNMGSAGWAVFPTGTALELKEAVKSGTDNPQAYVHELADKQCDQLILGQTLTSDTGKSGGGSHALGQVHAGIRDEIIRGAADIVEGALQQLVCAIVILNFGDDRLMPRATAESVREDEGLVKAQRDQVLIQSGVALPKEWLYERHEIPMPEEGEDVVTGSAQQNPDAQNNPSARQGPADGQKGNQQTAAPSPEDPADAAAQGDDVEARAALVLGKASMAESKLADLIAEEVTGIEAKWLGGAKPWFVALIQAAKNPALTDEEFERFLEARAARVPQELAPLLKPEAVATAMEQFMGAAAVNGAVKAYLARMDGKGLKN